MIRALAIACVFLPVDLLADNLWLQAAGSTGAANGSRFGASRTLEAFGLHGATIGFTHNRAEQSWWTVLDAGMNRRLSSNWIVSGTAQMGPGQLDDTTFSYRRLGVAATWLISSRWSLEVSDSYVNVDTTIGHVIGSSLTRYMGDFSVSLHALGSVGSAIDNQQIGASFRRSGEYPLIGGLYAGKTSNPTTLSQVGSITGADGVRLRQAYAGITVPIGDYSLMAVADYTRLGDADRQELSLVLTIPLGQQGDKR